MATTLRTERLPRLLASLLLGLAVAAAMPGPAQAQDGPAVTDLAGRQVLLPQPPKRLVLADGFVINALNVLEADPVALIAGWSKTFKTIDPDSYALYRKRFPAIDAVPAIGEIGAGGVSIEQIVALQPDLVVLPIELAGNDKLVQRLASFRIPAVFVDFYIDPRRNTVPSLRILGRLLGRETKAEAFVAFFEDRIRRIEVRRDDGRAPVKVLFQSHAGTWKCCWSPGSASLGAFVALANGLNIGATPLPAQGGWLSREYVVAEEPAVYIATGRPQNGAQGGLAIGPGVSVAQARQSLATLAAASDLRTLPAIRDKRVFGLWNFFLDTPANVVAAEVIAKWIDPERFRDIDPARTLAELNGFLAVPMEGVYWVGLETTAGAD